MKRQHKFQSEAEILKAIDAAHRKMVRFKKAIETHRDMAELSTDLKEKREHEEEAEKLWGKIERLQNTRLKKLGLTLSAFRTVPLGAASGVSGLNEAQVTLQAVN